MAVPSRRPRCGQLNQQPPARQPDAKTLRPYQRDAVASVLAGIAANPRAYIAMPTGSGKSVVLGAIAAHLVARGRLLVVVHRVELVEQLARAMREGTGHAVGTLANGTYTLADAPIIVALVQSLTPKRLDVWLAHGPVAAVFVDEAHRVAPGNAHARVIEAVLSARPEAVALGCTATPYRMGKGRMQDMLPRCLFERTILDLIELDVLAPLRHARVPIAINLRSVRKTAGDYALPELAHEMIAAVEATVAKTRDLIAGRRSIAFAVDVAHGLALRDAYEAAGVNAFFVCGNTPKAKRAAAIAAWRSTPGACFVNVDIAREGFDEPSVSAIVMAAPTQSPGRYVQSVGRGTRKADGKVDCLVIDVTGNGPVDERQAMFDDVFVAFPGSGAPPESTPAKRGFITNPRGDERNGWFEPEPDVWALSIDGGCAWFVHRDRTSGVWNALLLRATRIVKMIDGVPLAEAIARIHEQLRTAGCSRLVAKHAPWRLNDATENQLAHLARLESAIAERARANSWRCGRVSDAIGLIECRRIILRYGGVDSAIATARAVIAKHGRGK